MARQAVDRQAAAAAAIIIAEVTPPPTPAAPLLPAGPSDRGFGRSPAVHWCFGLVHGNECVGFEVLSPVCDTREACERTGWSRTGGGASGVYEYGAWQHPAGW